MSNNVNSIVGALKKEYGDSAVTQGHEIADVSRLSTGIFHLDLATGGGFPEGKISIVYGPESSGKTNICLKSIAWYQQTYPDRVCVFVDVENSYDKNWAAAMGVNVETLVVVRPDYGEMAVDMVEALLNAEDVGLVVIDSLAALIPAKQGEASAERVQVAGNAIVVQSLMQKIVLTQSRVKKFDRYPTVLCVNQTRMEVGKMFGDPEKMPGGQALKFASGLTVRVYGKNEMDNKVSKTMPVTKHMSIIVKKWKVPIVATKCEFSMTMVPHKGRTIGFCDDWNTIAHRLRDCGLLEKGPKGKGWVMFDSPYKTLDECKAQLESNPEWGNEVRAGLILRARNDMIEAMS